MEGVDTSHRGEDAQGGRERGRGRGRGQQNVSERRCNDTYQERIKYEEPKEIFDTQDTTWPDLQSIAISSNNSDIKSALLHSAINTTPTPAAQHQHSSNPSAPVAHRFITNALGLKSNGVKTSSSDVDKTQQCAGVSSIAQVYPPLPPRAKQEEHDKGVGVVSRETTRTKNHDRRGKEMNSSHVSKLTTLDTSNVIHSSQDLPQSFSLLDYSPRLFQNAISSSLPWRCQQCTFDNSPHLQLCEMCNSKKPERGNSRKKK